MFIGRLWNSTFVEDYASGVNQVHIYSRAKLAIGPSIRQNRTNDDSTFVSFNLIDYSQSQLINQIANQIFFFS